MDEPWQIHPAGAALLVDRAGLTFEGFLRGLRDPEFRAGFVQVLRDAPFAAFCWECPPLLRSSIGRPFECRLVDSPALARVSVDPTPFAEHFGAAPCARFRSLGGDAVLVAPAPSEPLAANAHLAAFVRGAPADRIDALWIEVAAAASDELGDRPRWLSTAGLGVSWLHVRLDQRPKYYRTREYA